jgi:DUF4097 and DUF4098 domain-containing protein YvlB
MRTETFETPGPLTVRVRVSSSELEVETWEHPTTRIEIEGGRELVDSFTVALEDRPGGQEVVIEDPKSRMSGFRFREARASVRVRCPEAAALAAVTGSADVTASGTLGRVEVKTGSGDVVLRGAAEALRVTSASGDVKAQRVTGPATVATASGDIELGVVGGPLAVNAVSGDVSVRDAHAGAAVESVSGDVTIDAVGGGDIRAQTVSGDVKIGIATGTAVWIDASSVSGDLESQLEVEDRPPAGDEPASPVFELRVRTVSGDALVTRGVSARSRT